MNEKTSNKHYFPHARSYTFDSEKNEWKELSDNFYFLDGDDAKTCYFNAEDGKNFFYEHKE